MLERLGLHRPELRAWALYDWANSAFILVVITTVFPIYYKRVAAAELDAARADFWFSTTTAVALTLVAVLAPVLGALGDYLGRRKQFLAAFLGLGCAATALLYFVGEGDWKLALLLFAVGNLGVSTSFVFYDSLLPHLASSDEIDRVSTAGYAMGYLGSGLLLIGDLWLIENPHVLGLADGAQATRFAYVTVALWWALFALPLLLRVPEPPRVIEADETDAASALRVTLSRLVETFHELRGDYWEAFKMLAAMLIYNDGIGTIIRMAAIYAASRGIPDDKVILAILVVQFVGIPFAFLFGLLASWIGAKRSILLALAVYCGISIVAYRMETVAEFYVLAALVGMVQGGAQGLSRSLFASMVPKHKAAECFGFFSVFEKFAGILGPAIFSVMILATGSSREAILSVIAFFVIGGALLVRVDVDLGRRKAREAEATLLAAESASPS